MSVVRLAMVKSSCSWYEDEFRLRISQRRAPMVANNVPILTNSDVGGFCARRRLSDAGYPL
jgi:hypothetical protein